MACEKVATALHIVTATKLANAVLLCEGDTTGNLMWRLEHGESPAGAGVKAIVLLIGANDLLIAASDVRHLTTRRHVPSHSHGRLVNITDDVYGVVFWGIHNLLRRVHLCTVSVRHA